MEMAAYYVIMSLNSQTGICHQKASQLAVTVGNKIVPDKGH